MNDAIDSSIAGEMKSVKVSSIVLNTYDADAIATKAIAPSTELTSDVILGEQIGGQRGSNAGGFFRGKDGVTRYVKFYEDSSQAWCEHLSNQIYRDLGHGVPDSVVFEHEGKWAYASKVFDGGKTVAQVGLNPERAKKIMDGFLGDVITANWDAVGTGMDNVMVLPNGSIVRIDNGGSFLFRAKEGRKSETLLNAITEWEKFFDPSVNYDYSKIARVAGYERPEDLIEHIKSQFKALQKIKGESGWIGYVRKHAPGISTADKITSMLNTRTRLIEQKLAGATSRLELELNGAKPRKGLKFEDLPRKSYA
jgi:hypothetical protein